MKKISYVNGKFIDHENANTHIEDRAYQFSDGVYEVVLIKSGVKIDWIMHCDRLRYSLLGLKINYQFCDDELGSLVDQLCSKNNLQDAFLYLQISRGVARRDHAFPPSDTEPVIVLTISPAKLLESVTYDQGVSIILLPDLRWKRRDFKTVSLLANILGKQEAVDAKAHEAVFFEEDGFVTDGSSTNCFIVDVDNNLRTHPANHRILNGITRQGIIKVAQELGVNVIEEMFTVEDVYNAREVFISSTTKHVLPVVKADGKIIDGGSPGNVTKKLIDAYKQYIAQQIG